MLHGRRVVILGLGISGRAAARASLRLGATVEVRDAAERAALEKPAAELEALGASVHTGGLSGDVGPGDLVVVSPGIPPRDPAVLQARAAGAEVIGELELGARLARCDLLAVTGTNGKTTTTALLAAMLARAAIPCAAAGNIGLPLVEAVVSVPPEGAIAVEASSFQLASTESFHPRVAVLLNIAEDHTDWHGSTRAYVAAKARITANQDSSDVLVANADDARVMEVACRSRARVVPFSATRPLPAGASVRSGAIVIDGIELLGVDELPLPGLAGVEDTLAAAAAALSYGVAPAAVTDAIRAFAPEPHRLQHVARIAGVDYIDDSKATNPHATLAALRGLDDVVLIAGGRSKGIDLSALAAGVPPVRCIVALGEAAAQLEAELGGVVEVVRVASMEDAVAQAAARARPGGSVLLSPACASLDMYGSYAQRGEHFARCVRALGGSDGDERRA